jgi:hypothetical protein
MKYSHSGLLLILLLPLVAAAQSNEKTLKGYLGVEGGESFVYKLVFTDSGGYIRGHSYTWLYEKSEVKATITGFIDKKNKTLSFKENNILYNKGFQSNTTICLINAVLRSKVDNGSIVFTGPITSSDVTNVSCGRGTVTFQDTEALRSLFTEPLQRESVAASGRDAKPPEKAIRVVYDTSFTRRKTRPIAEPYVPVPVKITQGQETAFEWTTDTIIIDIWDGLRIDGEVVTVLFNNDTALLKYALVKQPVRLVFPLSGEPLDVITIVAEDEGRELLCTANLLLTDGNKQYPIEAYNTVGKRALIKVRKAQPAKK